MKTMQPFFYVCGLFLITAMFATAQVTKHDRTGHEKVNRMIDNMGYWQRCAREGLVPVAPFTRIPAAIYTGSRLIGKGLREIDSPDICITTEPSLSTQSENSLVMDPGNENALMNSNNSTPQPSNGSVKGADALISPDAGESWSGTVEGAGGSNSGDPAAVIDLNGRYFIGFIDNAYGQSVAYSDNQGGTWTTSVAGIKPSGGSSMLDKNHLWADISPTSPFKGNIYDAWTAFGGSNNKHVEISRSITNGSSWEPPVKISGALTGKLFHGVNLKTGPDGEVYAAFTIYDKTAPLAESAMAFAKSLDGGITWQPAIRAVDSIMGIRDEGVTQNMRVNSFPCMAVDLSNGAHRGTIYIVWSNIGVPGINTGPGCDIYLIKSTDKGDTWSAPVKVNTDLPAGKQHYFPWITCDQATGIISLVFYDNRNCAPNQAEAWVAWSLDGGATFEDMKVSDVTFTPSPIPNMAANYMGDYLSIVAYGGKTIPCWTDTRSGHCLTYVSPIELVIPRSLVINTSNILNDTTYGNGNGLLDYGETELIGLKMKNTGIKQADSISVSLSCSNPYVTLQDSVLYYGDFATGQEKTILDGFKFSVSDSIPNGELILFTVKAIDRNDSITYSTFQIMSHAPDVSLLSMMILDPSGNNNGRLDPGENATIQIETTNKSIWDAENVVSTLTSANPFVTVTGGPANIGTLHAGETLQASFGVAVNPDAAIGSAAQLQDHTLSKWRATDKSFTARIGLLVEDWETGTMTKFPWEFTSAADPWTIDAAVKYEGKYSARSGAIGQGASTGISVRYNVMLDDSISFFRKVSSPDPNDLLKFYIDDLLVGIYSGEGGDTAFSRNVYPVMAGVHTFSWIYEKGSAGSSSPEDAWIDYIVFPPRYMTNVSAGGDGMICAGGTFPLNGLVFNSDSLHWSSSGSGIFSNPALLNPDYIPSAADNSAGSVKLTLTAFDQNIAGAKDSLVLTLAALPVVKLGRDTILCANRSILLDATTPDAASYLWTPSGKTTPALLVDSVGTGLHSREISVRVTNLNGCIGKDTVMVSFKLCAGIGEIAGARVQVYPNPTSGMVMVEMNTAMPKQLDIEILNAAGEPVFSQKELYVNGLVTRTLNLSGYPQGTYFVEISSGSEKVIRKLILQK
ncbi:MAG: T9SS type A sorting domain-containing protein [Bacteroidales bacterium]